MARDAGKAHPLITFTSDFGLKDYYVGAVKGVVHSIAPHARLVDISHDIGPQNIVHGAFVLRQIWEYFPEGSIHLAIVDPGVGTNRRIIVGRYAHRTIVAPDNGLVTLVHRDFPVESMIVAQNKRYFLPVVSATFHGRDIMAPIVAHLANGVHAEDLGCTTDRLELLSMATRAETVGGKVVGRALYADRFGNVITNIAEDQVVDSSGRHRAASLLVNGKHSVPIARTFSDVGVHEPVALIGSAGMLEIACNRGSAAERFGPVGDLVVEVQSAALR